MLGISFYELMVVLIIFIILFKPNEIISILFKLSNIVRKIKTFFSEINTKIEEITILGDPEDYFLKKPKEINKEKAKKIKVDNNKN